MTLHFHPSAAFFSLSKLIYNVTPQKMEEHIVLPEESTITFLKSSLFILVFHRSPLQIV
jgi:hypothetical protein